MGCLNMTINLETLILTRYDEAKHKELFESFKNGDSFSKFIHEVCKRLEASKNNFNNIFQSSFVVECNNIPIGYLYVSSNEKDEVFLEYSILKQYRNQGFGKMLLNQASDFLFQNYNIRCIRADVDPSNKNSMLLLESCGYIFDEEEYEKRNFIGNMQFFKESDCYYLKRRK